MVSIRDFAANQRTVVLHVGMAKSGTSSLQRRAFKFSKEITFLGIPSATENMDWAIRRICCADTLRYNEAEVRNIINLHVAKERRDKPLVISYENFCLYESKDKGLVAERLRSLFPHAKILFTLRKQEDLLASWYLQRVKRYARHKHYIDFNTWLTLKLKAPYRSILDDLNYYEVINFYVRLFGRRNVQIMFFEDLKADPKTYSESIAAFIGIPQNGFSELFLSGRENSTVPAATIPFSRFVAPLLPRNVVKPVAKWLIKRGGKPARIDIGDRGRELVRSICAESNRRLQETYIPDLEKRGYTLAPKEPSSDLNQHSLAMLK